MITAGLKLTGSGGIALVHGDRLLYSIGVDEIDNNPRGCAVTDLGVLPRLLAQQDYDLDDIDEWAIDGGDGATTDDVRLLDDGAPVLLRLAPYRETAALPDPVQPGYQGTFELGGRTRPYASYVHVASHLAAAYCTSPFAARGEPAMVLVWDDGWFPSLYHVDAKGRTEHVGALFPLVGRALAATLRRFGPDRRPRPVQLARGRLDDPREDDEIGPYFDGGTARAEVTVAVRELFHAHFAGGTPAARQFRQTIAGCGRGGEPSRRYVREFLAALQKRIAPLGVTDDDVLASVHEFTEEMLLDHLARRTHAWTGHPAANLCLAGGCALDLRWNTALRGHPTVAALWVPPFADESGSAIGTAAVHLGRWDGLRKLDWNLRSGPAVRRHAHVPGGWWVAPCRPEELARLIHRSGRPVVVLNGRAKLGGRALGARSILAPATDPASRGLLNGLRQRDADRPVAAVCLTENAPDVFDPGTPDPYMQFTHRVRPEWAERIPAVCGPGGVVRLQTVDAGHDPALVALLREYRAWSGIPVLCATVAGFVGCGPFPDAVSAMRWGEVGTVWSDGVLYRRVHSSSE